MMHSAESFTLKIFHQRKCIAKFNRIIHKQKQK